MQLWMFKALNIQHFLSFFDVGCEGRFRRGHRRGNRPQDISLGKGDSGIFVHLLKEIVEAWNKSQAET